MEGYVRWERVRGEGGVEVVSRVVVNVGLRLAHTKVLLSNESFGAAYIFTPPIRVSPP